jgi:hypothetical protein
MHKNKISVTAFLVDGNSIDVLTDVTPKDAIENYFMPDMRPPIESIILHFVGDNGKVKVISISQRDVVIQED